jgi:hypothetical protein
MKAKGSNSTTWKGYGKLSSKYFSGIKSNAKKRNILFNLDIQKIWKLFLKQNRQCALSGVFLEMSESRRTKGIMTASLDRIDSSKGYTLDNVQWVHKTINNMKNSMSDSEFVKWCQLVASNV